MSDPQAEARTIAHLTDWRARLLDVRAVDRWLNVRHAGPMAVWLPVLDDSPGALHSRLSGGRDLFFCAVPYPDPGWEREYASDFEALLEEERAVDLAWREALDAGELPGSERRCAVEIDLRARVCQKLGLPCREEHPERVAAEWLRQRGVDPEGGLSVADGIERLLVREEGELQTGLFAGDLRARLAQLGDEADLLFSEMAEEALRMAVGFLEWTPTGRGEPSAWAPLLMYRVEWVRRGESDRERLGIRGVEGPECNAVLRHRLETDFQIQLPVWEVEDSVAGYLARVAEAVSGCEGWKVVGRSALGVFPSSPSWMYLDADPKSWGGYQSLASAGMLHLLLEKPDPKALEERAAEEAAAREAGAEAGHREDIEGWFLEVDGDQQNVVRAALRGKNVRVDAPPGAGATQTVLQLIGSFLGRGKSVLVVSERGAALRELVEKSRDLGLGPFCVELFAGGARRAALLAGVVERQGVAASGVLAEAAALGVEAEACEQRLEQYLDLILQPFGQLEIQDLGHWRQATVHDVLWENVALRSQPPHFAGLDRVWLEDAELLTRADRERRRARLGILERAAREMRQRWGGVEGHPWGFVTRGDIQMVDVPDVEEVAAQALVRLEELQACGDALFARMRFDVEASTLAEVVEFSRMLQALPLPPEEAPDLLVRMLLLSPEAEERVREGLGWLREARRRREMLSGFFEGRPPESLEEEEWGEAVSLARAVGLGEVKLQGIAARAEDLRRRAAGWEKLKPFVQKCLDAFSLGEMSVSMPVLQRLVQALELLAGVERRVLLVRTPGILEEINFSILEAAQKAVRGLREGEERVRSVYTFDVRLTEMELREHANALVAVGWLGKWSGTYRRALGQARALVKQHAGLTDDQLAARLHQLADHLEALRRFDSDTALRQLLGERFRGPLTDIESCVEANRFAAAVRSKFVGQWEPECSLRRFFIQGSMDDFDSALALRADPQYADLVAFLQNVEDAPVGMEELVVGWETAAEEAQRLFRYFGGFGLRAEVTPTEALEVRFCFAELREVGEKLEGSSLKTWMGAEAWSRELTDPGILERALEYAGRLHAAVPAGVVRVVASGDMDMRDEAEEVRSQGLTLEGGAMRAVAALRALQGWVADPGVPLAVNSALAPFLTVGAVYTVLRRAQDQGPELGRCIAFRRAIEELRTDGLGGLLGAYEEAGEDYIGLESAYDRVLWRSLARRAVEMFPELGRASSDSLEQLREQWGVACERLREVHRRNLLAALSAVPVRRAEAASEGLPGGDAADLGASWLEPGGATELRQWWERAQDGIRRAKPCVFASPEAVAQHVVPGQLFDLVVVDGAARMRPERALGLLARARQVVLFGDEMLLPASTFAQRHAVGAVELAEQKADQPSLWETLGGAVEHRVLRGQYRVRAASLLAFANRHFYRNEIRVLPAPQETFPEPGRGLRLVRGPGTHRTGVHVTEARTVVEEALRCMREFPERSLAILTWTGAQRLFVQTELARAMARDPEAVRYRARWSAGREPLIVRQVDEAQGDVRDIVLLSLGLASEVAGVLEGAVRLEGNAGARRLNVALTRARVGMSVFCGVDPQRIRIDHRTPRGIVLLRQFLSFAAEGGISADAYSGVCIAARERFLGAILEAGGFQVAARAGAGEWRLDLVAAHPQKGPGFGWALVGDGGARAVQNRREVREWILGNALERVGWRVHRIWTGEWFRDPVRETERLREGLEGARLS